MYKLYKEDMRWDKIFDAFGRDSTLVKSFIIESRKKMEIEPNALDIMLNDIASKVKSYVEVGPSGNIKFF